MVKRAIRMGIDVGGTFTKAVALDNDTHEILGKASVLTTHTHEAGVAAGVVKAFERCLSENNISPDEVIFIAHSTTQATNALLEGDVAEVGIVGMASGFFEGLLAKRQTNLNDVPLGTGKSIKTHHMYLDVKSLSNASAKTIISELKSRGARVVVASRAFGVDSTAEESLLQDVAAQLGIPATAGHEITKLYGLTVRTRSAVINASILPRMFETAKSTEGSVRKTGIKAPLMIMRGDGGVMDIAEVQRRPVLTMLSGPAASVIGALMYLRASNGIYFEVGGTSTNIGVIKNGRPTINYAVVGGHRTAISSLDVRVLGVAGGSMVRISGGSLVDVGPRSAHIAGLGYAAFTDESEIVDPVIEFVQPKLGDPADYVTLRLKNGKRIAVTNTCAANVLKLTRPQWHAYGNYSSCCKAMKPLAEMLGMTIEETARAILTKATDKILPIVEALAREYKLEQDQIMLVGCGGGASSLLPFTAERTGLKFKIPEQAEVISSIGVGLAMVRDVVERVIPNPTSEDIKAIKREARQAAISSGAVPDTVEIYIEINAQTQQVRAIALGSTAVQTTDLLKEASVEESRALAADSMCTTPEDTVLVGQTPALFVFSSKAAKQKGKHPIRVVDRKGFIKVQRGDAAVQEGTVSSVSGLIDELWETMTNYKSDMILFPDVYLCIGGRVLDYSGMPSKDHIMNVISTELDEFLPEDQSIVVAAKNDL
ncbi:hydantoinase [Anaerosporomusa subterranea]|uniref:Hydantoinase n=2 Tax=Anaerosporomusa subterranea TaxID=1794912 RepID=A0A154BMY7_ANASB|nr:hydantoinase [Anaerosporomusa subterranea]